MSISLQDMRDALKGQSRADEAIFWFGYFWNAGPQSDLYRIMCETIYDPHFYEIRKQAGSDKSLTPASDPAIVYAHVLLRERWEKSFGPLREYPLRPIRFGTLKENDVVICGPGRQFACIPADWALSSLFGRRRLKSSVRRGQDRTRVPPVQDGT